MRASFALPSLFLLSFALLFLSVSATPEVVEPWSLAHGGELFTDMKLNLQELVEDAATRLSSSLPPTSEVVRRPHHHRVATNDTCRECVSGVSKHIVESVVDAVTTACANVTCPVIKKRCDWIASHAEEFKGYVVASTRSYSSGYFYCYGKGECDHPSMPEIEHSLFGRHDLGYSLAQGSVASKYIEKISAKLLEPVPSDEPDRPTMLGGDSLDSEVAQRNGPVFEYNQKSSHCHQCLKHSVHWVLKRAHHHLKEACKHTECPKFKEFCDWAEGHKEMVKGIVYAHTQPWKYAIGWCFGKSKCHGAAPMQGEVRQDISDKTEQTASIVNEEMPFHRYRRIAHKRGGGL